MRASELRGVASSPDHCFSSSCSSSAPRLLRNVREALEDVAEALWGTPLLSARPQPPPCCGVPGFVFFGSLVNDFHRTMLSLVMQP